MFTCSSAPPCDRTQVPIRARNAGWKVKDWQRSTTTNTSSLGSRLKCLLHQRTGFLKELSTTHFDCDPLCGLAVRFGSTKSISWRSAGHDIHPEILYSLAENGRPIVSDAASHLVGNQSCFSLFFCSGFLLDASLYQMPGEERAKSSE